MLFRKLPQILIQEEVADPGSKLVSLIPGLIPNNFLAYTSALSKQVLRTLTGQADKRSGIPVISALGKLGFPLTARKAIRCHPEAGGFLGDTS